MGHTGLKYIYIKHATFGAAGMHSAILSAEEESRNFKNRFQGRF